MKIYTLDLEGDCHELAYCPNSCVKRALYVGTLEKKKVKSKLGGE